MLKIRRPLGRLIFNMGVAIPGKTIFLIEMAPRLSYCIFSSRVVFNCIDIFCSFSTYIRGSNFLLWILETLGVTEIKTDTDRNTSRVSFIGYVSAYLLTE